MKIFNNKRRLVFCVGLIFGALYIWSAHMESKAREVDAYMYRLGNYLSFPFPDGLPKGMSFMDALQKASNLGLVDPNGINPLPDFLPQADYHYEKKLTVESEESPRVVCWVSIRYLIETHYYVLYSDWSEKVVWDSPNLPEFK